MDGCESEKQSISIVEKTRVNKNGNLRMLQTRDARSKYTSSPTASKRSISPTASKCCTSPTASKRCTSPLASRTSSAERRRPSSSSPRSPSTPIAETLLASKNILGQPTPERKQRALKGNNYVDHSENSSLNPHHRWPRRKHGKVDTSVDMIDKHSSLFHRPSLRRLSLDGIVKPLMKSANDFKILVSRDDSRKSVSKDFSEDDSPSPGSSARAFSDSTQPLRPLSSRGPKSLNPFSRLPTPARSSNYVLSFIKPVNKAANQIEDVHQLRILYNRHLQWRYVNACNDSSLHSLKLETEKMFYSVWMTNADLWDSIMEKRIDLLQLRLKLKLYSVLKNQIACLDEWAITERGHINSLIQDLQARADRIPFTGRARGDIKSVKAAICSAVDVMHAMGFSLCSILSRIRSTNDINCCTKSEFKIKFVIAMVKVEGMNSLVSQLSYLAMQERAMFEEYEFFLGSTTALQVEEQSIKTHLLQISARRNVNIRVLN